MSRSLDPSFLDEVKVFIQGGNGGNGCISFRREKFVPKGGPNGGDGGEGGSVFVQVEGSLTTLVDFRFHHHFRAGRGEHGQGSRKAGKNGRDVVLMVPPGTRVLDEHKVILIGDLFEPGERLLVAAGGRGGRGNWHFASSTRQAPRIAEPGEEGEGSWIWLELKLLADVGLVGFPNAGKSTLLSRISKARPRVGSYPFTTLVPVLGILETDRFETFVVADIPGIIEGAHEGQGLGIRFLKHLERSRLLVFLLDISEEAQRDPVQDLEVLQQEMLAFHPDLMKKPRILAATKIDAAGDGAALERIEAYCRERREKLWKISALRKEGLEGLLGAIQETLEKLPPRQLRETPSPVGEPVSGGGDSKR
ncbi:MAG: GTPase ObgE [Acidobacteriota bacterium]